MRGAAVLVASSAFCLALAALHSTWGQVGLPWPGPGTAHTTGGGSSNWTFVASTGEQPNTGNPTTPAVNMTGATCIVITISGFGAWTGVPTDTSSNTYIAGPDGLVTNTSGTNSEMFYVSSPTVTSSMQFGAANSSGQFSVFMIAGFSASHGCTIDKHSSTANSNTPGSLTPTASGALFVTGFVAKDADTAVPTIGSSFVIPTKGAFAYSSGNNEGGGQAYLLQGTASAQNPAWAATGGNTGSSQMIVFQ